MSKKTTYKQKHNLKCVKQDEQRESENESTGACSLTWEMRSDFLASSGKQKREKKAKRRG
jgi:hypothetical protein